MPQAYDLPVDVEWPSEVDKDWRDLPEPEGEEYDDDEEHPAPQYVIDVLGVDPDDLFPPTTNVFCPTGKGGGIDPTCSPGGGKRGMSGYAGEVSSIEKKYGVANTGGKDTQQRYKNPDGSYSPARAKLHDDIEAEHFKGKTPVGKDETPTLYFMGGGPASGKGSVIRGGHVNIPKRAVTVDPDEVKSQLPEYKAAIKHGEKSGASYVHEESSELGKRILRKSVSERYDTVMDGTGNSTVEKVRSKVAAARAQGNRVVANYVTVDTETAITRSDKRGERSGRVVPHEVIRSIHASVSRVVPQAVAEGLFDEFNLYDNNGDAPKLVASAVGKNLTVHDQAAWRSFLRKGEG